MAGNGPQEPGCPTLLEWFQMTRTVKSGPASHSAIGLFEDVFGSMYCKRQQHVLIVCLLRAASVEVAKSKSPVVSLVSLR